MRKRATAAATPAPAAIAPDAPVPSGYAILAWHGWWRPVLIVAAGDGLWSASKPVYRELSQDGRTGAVCDSRAKALAVIVAHQAWRERQDEIDRAAAAPMAQTTAKRGKRR